MAEYKLKEMGKAIKIVPRPSKFGMGCGASIAGTQKETKQIVDMLTGSFDYKLNIMELVGE